MTEYLIHKLELGKDERVLSQVISEAMSPKRTSGDLDVGCVWISFILLKTKNNKKITVHTKNTVYLHCSCPMNSAIGVVKKKKKTQETQNVSSSKCSRNGESERL